MKKETRNRIEKLFNYAKNNNLSVLAACKAKKYNYNTLLATLNYARNNGTDADILEMYDSVKKSGNNVEHIDTDERAETELVRDEDGRITSYRFKIFRRDKSPVVGVLNRDEMNLIYRLYSYYGSSLTQRQVSRHFPDYSLIDFKRILRAFNITKACSPFAPHVIEEHSDEELQEMQLREKENDFLKAVEKNEVRDLKQLIVKLTQQNSKLITEEKLVELIKSTNKDYEELPVNTNNGNPTYPALIIWLSDLHIGAYNAKYSSFVTLPNYDKEEIKARLAKIVQTFYGQSYGAVYVVNLGDSIDGYNKETTRGGHQLPEVMDDKEISETYIECMMEFFKSLKTNVKSDEFNYLCIGESNHDGNWGWLNNKLLAAYLANEGVKSYISNYPIDNFIIGKHSWIFTHGKDAGNQTRQFPLTLNPQTELYFANYIAEQNISNKYIYVVKGDLHNYAYTTGKQFDYISVGSMYGSSNYIVANFGHTKWSINYSVVTKDNMMMGTIKGSN